MIRFRPRLAPTLFTIPVVAALLALGVWQLQRLEWKSRLIAERATAVAVAPVPPPQTLAEARALEFHRVTVEGVFLHDKEILLNAIAAKGDAGFDVLTPLRDAVGRIVFVNRGFVPTELKDRATRPAGQPAGTMHVSGLLRVPPQEKPGWFIPDNRPDRNAWFWVDLPAMAAADGLANVAPFYIDADAAPNPGGWPKGGVTPLALPNDHLQYAITWFSLAAALMVIYVVYHSRGGGPG
jgi:surfeit locus 1 family protein